MSNGNMRFGIVITADTKTAVDGIDHVTKAVDGVTAGAEGAAVAVENLNQRMRDPSTGRFVSGVDGAGKSVKKFGEDVAGASAQLPKLNEGLSGVGKAVPAAFAPAETSAKQLSQAMRQIPMQMTDIVTSLASGMPPMMVLMQQGGQLKDSFGGVGAAASAVGQYIVSLINPLTVTTAAAVGLVAVFANAEAEAKALNQSLLLTGNSAGVIFSDLDGVANKSAEAIGTTKGAAFEAVAMLNNTAAVSKSNLGLLTDAVLLVGKSGLMAAEDLVKGFEELGKSPVEASKKLQAQHNYLTQSVIDQINALNDLGKVQEAGELAQKAYADAMRQRAQQAIDDLGYLERVWHGIAGAAKSGWDAMLGVGRKVDTLQVLREQLAGKRFSIYSEDELKSEISRLEAIEAKQRQVANDAAANAKKIQASEALGKIQDTVKTKAEKRDDEVAKVKALGESAGWAKERVDALVSAVNKKYEDKGAIAAARKEANALENALQRINAKTSGFNSNYADDLKTLEKSYRGGKLSTDQYREAVENLIKQQPFWVKQLKEEADALRVRDESLAKSVAADVSAIEAANKRSAALEEQTAMLGKSKSEHAEYKANLLETQAASAKLAASELDEAAARLEANNILPDVVARYRELADTKRQLADATLAEANAEKIYGLKEASVEAAKAASDAWKNFESDISRSLTDSLMRSSESGKSAAKAFVDGVKNALKTAVIKVPVQAIVSTVMGQIGSAMGVGGSSLTQSSGGFDLLGLAKLANGGSGGGSLMSMFAGGVGGAFGGSAYSSMPSAYTYGFTQGASAAGDAFWAAQDAFQAGGSAANLQFAESVQAGASAASYLADGLGYLNAAVSAANGKWGSAAGAAIGTYFGGPLGSAIGGTIGGFVDGMFGGDGLAQRTGSGYQLDTSGAGYKTALGGFNPWANNKWFSGAEMNTSLDAFAKKIQDVDAFLAKTLSPSDIAAAQAALRGKEVSASYGMEHTDVNQSGAFEKIMTERYQAVLNGLMAGLGDLAASGGITSDEVESLVSQLGTLKKTFALVNSSLADTSTFSDVITALGGMQAAGQTLSSYYQGFFTENQRLAITAGQVNDEFKKLGIEMPATRDEFRKLVEGLDLASNESRSTFSALINISSAFGQVADAAEAAAKQAIANAQELNAQRGSLLDQLFGLVATQSEVQAAALAKITDPVQRVIQEQIYLAQQNAASADKAKQGVDALRSAVNDAYNQQLAALNQSAGSMQAVANSIGDFAKSLTASYVTQAQAPSVATASYTAVRADALAGKEAGLSGFIEAARGYAETLKQSAGSDAEYRVGIARIAADANRVQGVAVGKVSEAQQQIELLKKMVDGIATVGKSTLGVKESVDAFNKASADYDKLMVSNGATATANLAKVSEGVLKQIGVSQSQLSLLDAMKLSAVAQNGGLFALQTAITTLDKNTAKALEKNNGTAAIAAALGTVNASVVAGLSGNNSLSSVISAVSKMDAANVAALSANGTLAARLTALSKAPAETVALWGKDGTIEAMLRRSGSASITDSATKVGDAKSIVASVNANTSVVSSAIVSSSSDATRLGLYQTLLGLAGDANLYRTIVSRFGIDVSGLSGWAQRKGIGRIPGFASGGNHIGGLRIVGEVGPELEVTGAARYMSNAALQQMLTTNASDGLLKEVVSVLKDIRDSAKNNQDRNAVATLARAARAWETDGMLVRQV